MSPNNLYEYDVIYSFKSKYLTPSLYNVFFNEKIEAKYDFVLASAHDPSVFLYKKNANILISVISYVPTMDHDLWASFYTNICLSDVLVIDKYNLELLNQFSYPEKRIILIDGAHISVKPKITKKEDLYTIYNADPVNKKLWDRFVEYNASVKDSTLKVTTNPKEAYIALSMYPLGYALTYQFVNQFGFFNTAFNNETSSILDSRSIHHLGKRLGPIMDVKGSAYTPQIKEELKVFSETLITLVDHLETTKMGLFRYSTNQPLLDRIFHQLNATYKS